MAPIEATKLNRNVPRHRQIFDMLRREIRDGTYRSGDRLPAETELMRQLGVSRSTVSRALRDLERLGLVRRRRGSGTFVREKGAVPAGLELAFFAPWATTGEGLPRVEGRIHQYLADLAGQAGARLTLQCLNAGPEDLRKRMLASAEKLKQAGVQGVLYYPAELPAEQMHFNREVVDFLTRSGMSVVLIDRDIVTYPERSEFTRIGYDNRRGGYLLTEHLLETGCRDIAFVGIPQESTAVLDRIAGYHEALRAYGLTSRLDRVHFSVEPDEAMCRTLVEQHPDAIICKSDRFAALVGRYLLGMGIRIGADIRLAGFDDDPIASFLPAPLTTIRLPAAPFARAALEAVHRQLDDPAQEARQVIIDTELIIRESTMKTGNGDE